MYSAIEQVIHAFDGHVYAVAGFIHGFFDDPGQTQACARVIVELTHREVEVFGSQLSMML